MLRRDKITACCNRETDLSAGHQANRRKAARQLGLAGLACFGRCVCVVAAVARVRQEQLCQCRFIALIHRADLQQWMRARHALKGNDR